MELLGTEVVPNLCFPKSVSVSTMQGQPFFRRKLHFFSVFSRSILGPLGSGRQLRSTRRGGGRNHWAPFGCLLLLLPSPGYEGREKKGLVAWRLLSSSSHRQDTEEKLQLRS